MISRRDIVLKRPWEVRRYEYHRKKVQSALPVIDSNPPVKRTHVSIKLKRKQKEQEKCAQIEKDNLILLRKLNSIMKKSQTCTYSTTPKIVGRVELYQSSRKPKNKPTELFYRETQSVPGSSKSRKSLCYACNPELQDYEFKVSEERVPWEPPKVPISKRFRSKSVPARRPQSKLPPLEEQTENSSSDTNKKRSSSCKEHFKRKDCLNSANSIILRRGALVLSVNFPSDTFIKYKSGRVEQVLQETSCHCKSLVKT